MTVITYDVVADLKQEFSDGWNSSKVCSAPKPDIQIVWDIKSVGFGGGTRPRLYITPMPETIRPFQLHGDAHWHELVLKIDLRSYKGIEMHNNMVKTVSNILKNIIRRGAEGFLDVIIMGSEDMSAEMRNKFRTVLTVKYRDVESFTFV